MTSQELEKTKLEELKGEKQVLCMHISDANNSLAGGVTADKSKVTETFARLVKVHNALLGHFIAKKENTAAEEEEEEHRSYAVIVKGINETVILPPDITYNIIDLKN